MDRCVECDRCAFLYERGYVDMGCTMDVCRYVARRDLWRALMSNKLTDKEKAHLSHCPYYLDLEELIAEREEHFIKES